MRVKRGVQHTKSRRSLLKRTKGFGWGRKSKVKAAHEAVKHAGKHSFAHRRTKKRERRAQWQIAINAGARENGMTYSTFIHALKTKNADLDRKVLTEIAEQHPDVFASIVKQLQS